MLVLPSLHFLPKFPCSASQEPPSQCSQLLPNPLVAWAGFCIHPPGLGNFFQPEQDGAGGSILHGPPRAGSCQERMQFPPPSPAAEDKTLIFPKWDGIVPIPPSSRGWSCSWEGEKHPLMSREPVGIFKKEGKTGLGRTIEFKIFGADESAGVVLGAGVTLQWEVAGNWGKDEPSRRGERVGEGKQLN